MQHHLQESQEHLSRGQNEMKTTLSNIHTSLEAGQDRIVQLLMQMVHGKEAPHYGGNNGATGSHGGERYQVESNHRAHTERQSLFGGATNKIPGYSRDTPRPYMPSFLDP